MSAKRKRKVIPLETPAPENVIRFPKQQGRYNVIVKPIPCNDLPLRLLQIYRVFGYTGDTTPTSDASAGNTRATLIHDAETNSDGTA